MIPPETPVLYHVTTRDSAEAVVSEGYKMRDWGETFTEWNLSLDFDQSTWSVPDYVDDSLVGVALAERLFEEERFEGHPSRAHAGFFYTNPWTAREKMRSGTFGDVCVVVQPDRLNGPIGVGKADDVGRVFSLVLDAVESGRAPLESMDTLREWAREYWLYVQDWDGHQHPRTEVFVPASTRVPASSVLGCIEAPEELARVGERERLRRYE